MNLRNRSPLYASAVVLAVVVAAFCVSACGPRANTPCRRPDVLARYERNYINAYANSVRICATQAGSRACRDALARTDVQLKILRAYQALPPCES